MVNIKVAVRIRPLSKREILRGEEVVVRKENKFVLVTKPKIPDQDGDSRERARRFAVDFCYDFKDPENCNQEAVYKEIGLEVLHSMFDGFNACVLAYGHSASGKTYTIMGLPDDPGLTPRLCQGLFDKLNEKLPDDKIQVQVIISFLEIYNEKVRDLLGSNEVGATSGNFSLRVREHPKLGPYVQGLSQHLVTDKNKLVGLLTTGNRRRSTAATENNIHSSRSHAVFTIQFKQSDGENYETDKSSKVHLVDLAGSERATSSQNKARLKEGANINKSLVTLGNVISVLAESYDSETFLNKQCRSKTWQPFVPYRDSVLTWLLKDTLGGNSNTIMIATISPASGSVSETVNTLRYAKRTKRIVNQPMMNEDPKVRTIRQLRKEITQLRCLLLSLHSCRSLCELEEANLESEIAITNPKTKWLDFGGRKKPAKEVNKNKKDNLKKVPTGEEEITIWNNTNFDEKIIKKVENVVVPTTPFKYERGVFEQRAAPSGGDACKINDEKKSDVNGSVNDNFSHETQIFSDSLESFSSVFLKSGNSYDADYDNSRLRRLTEYAYELGESHSKNLRFHSTREFGSCDNLPRKVLSTMLGRSRPDLIKGISSRSKERLLSRSSPSCTDLSDLDQSASENSLISSGSAEKKISNKLHLINPGHRTLKSQETGVQGKTSNTRKDQRNEILPTTIKKNEKRSEIVNAVTSRLYVTKKKLGRKAEISKNKCNEEEELEELKLCRRARMKLFDLSRKLALTRIKKTMDNDSQTDCMTATLRLKEKGVATDENGGVSFKGVGILEECSKEEEKPCVIMNQVFIPRASNYVVECGNVVRIQAPEIRSRHETATQTLPERGSFKNANTSPIKICIREEDCFSEDSLDSEDKGRSCDYVSSAKEITIKNEIESAGDVNFRENPRNWHCEDGTYFSCISDTRFKKDFKTKNVSENSVDSKEILYDEMCLAVSKKEGISSSEDVGFVPAYFSDSSLEESRKDENLSSENSFMSAGGTDISCSSETSSEDFVFYENLKDKESVSKTKETGDRELYTITENSEQSDHSEAFSPCQSHVSFPGVQGENKKDRKRNEISRRLLQSVKNQNNFEFESKMKREVKMFAQPKETQELSKCNSNNFEEKSKRNCENRKTSTEHYDKVSNFPKTSNFIKNKPEILKIPKPVSLTPAHIASEKVDGMLKNFPTLRKEKDTATEKENEEKINLSSSNRRTQSENVKPRSNQTTWKNLDPHSQNQYLNLNISSSSRDLPFSVGTHLFDESLQKDQSTDTMFNSSDSITFVFMGPAKPKTSVLMEIIRRSLGNGTFSSEIPFIQEKSKNRGVQCDVNLVRSVSVDTAIIALSRLTKKEEPSSDLHKSSSLGALSSNATFVSLEEEKFLGQRDTGSQCNLDVECIKREGCKTTLQCSIGTSTSTCDVDRNEITKSNGSEKIEKPKKSVSWCGEKKHLWEMKSEASKKLDQSEASDFDLNYRGLSELRAKDTNEDNFSKFLSGSKKSEPAPGRRVRFSKPETNSALLPGEPEDSLTVFLNEAIQLLKNLNFSSAKYSMLSDEAGEKFGAEGHREIKESGKKLFRKFENSESFLRSMTGGCLEKGENRSSKKETASKADESKLNLTWPRRRPIAGKPPTGMKPKLLRSPLPSRSNSPRSQNSLDFSTNLPIINRMDSNAQTWRLSNFSVDLGDSCLGETQSKPLSYRSFYGDETQQLRDYCSQPNLTPKSQASKLNFDSFSELESELEESCRRLEIITEQDEMREKILKNQKTALDCLTYEEGMCTGNFDREEECKAEMMKERKIIKRRKMEECISSCTCKTSNTYPCKSLWSKGCRSSFELDSFGPGSTHCRQLCMFCRKKNAEIYCSAVSLNSECLSSGLCRLDFYGFCPCSSFRLSHVASSPRAYMQHLLGLRRQIVKETKLQQLDLGERELRVKTQRVDPRNCYWGPQTELLAPQKFT